MSECIFCKIINGEIPSHKIWENDEFLAILDISPNTKGMTLVMPKKHYNSYAFEMPDDIYQRFMQAGKEVAKLLDKKLKTQRTALVMEGMGVNHAHLKLYPLHGLGKKFISMEAKEKVFFENYPGYLSTLLGPQADSDELKKLAEKIRE
ncbi:MAG: HIT domain-containing protein [Patescibacteria group bacterium]|nr:HIT domain-containing protein [Patescibacteria group bacterium]MDD5172653.1 HIT domain-containing protein [Patescibacteria group bacterium]